MSSRNKSERSTASSKRIPNEEQEFVLLHTSYFEVDTYEWRDVTIFQVICFVDQSWFYM